MEAYSSPQIELLAAQLLRGPRRLRLRQLLSIEFLLSVVEPGGQYPYDFVCHALTGYRSAKPEPAGARLLAADDLVPDLVALAEVLSGDADIPAGSLAAPAYTVAELAERFDVSTKTICRWRRRGLAGWRFRFPDRRVRVLFPDHSVRRFVARHADLVARGSQFSQLTAADRERIVARAQEVAAAGPRTVNAVARVIASEVGRAVETVRLILKHYDDAHPGAGIFNRAAAGLAVDGCQLAMWEAYQDGATIEQLGERFGRPVTAVYRAITAVRARELRARPMDLTPSPEFEASDAEQVILGTPAVALYQPLSTASRRIPAGLPPYLAQLFRLPLLTAEGERVLFRKLNYLRFKADRLRQQIDPETAQAAELDRIEELLAEAAEVKSQIVQANLRLVVGIAKRHLNVANDLFELISDGNVSLMRAVDRFDYMRGFKFSTYASWAIMKNFARTVPELSRHRDHYRTGRDELLDATAAPPGPDESETDELAAVRHTVDRMLSTLDIRERMILRQRYGLEDPGVPQTLEQVGQRFGVSKERIRQLEARAIRKLRLDFQVDIQRLLGP
jgi:RNA polymerase primary sigma factor